MVSSHMTDVLNFLKFAVCFRSWSCIWVIVCDPGPSISFDGIPRGGNFRGEFPKDVKGAVDITHATRLSLRRLAQRTPATLS